MAEEKKPRILEDGVKRNAFEQRRHEQMWIEEICHDFNLSPEVVARFAPDPSIVPKKLLRPQQTAGSASVATLKHKKR
jgi:hypothetical protein